MTLKRIFCLLLTLALLLLTGAAMAEEEADIIYDVTDYLSSISALDLAPHKGKIIILFFYTCESAEAKATLPIWPMIRNDFAPRDVEIILVHAWENEGQEESDTAKRLYKLEGLNIYEDKDCSFCHTLGLSTYPNLLILNAEGSPASGYSGQVSYPTIADTLTALGAKAVQNSYLPPAN